MKLKMMFAALAAVVSGLTFGAPAVTPRQLTNACNRVAEEIAKEVAKIQQEDDKLYIDDEGAYFTVLENEGGTLTNKKYRVRMTTSAQKGEWESAVVKSSPQWSSNGILTNGQVLAISYDSSFLSTNILSWGNSTVLTWLDGTKETNKWSYVKVACSIYNTIPVLTYTNYTFSGAWYSSNAARRDYIELSGENIDYEGREVLLRQSVVRCDSTWVETGRVVQAEFTIEPRLLFKDAWTNALMRLTTNDTQGVEYVPTHPTSNWWWNKNKWVVSPVKQYIQFHAVQPPVSRMRKSKSGLTVLKGGSSSAPSIQLTLYEDIPHGCVKVSTFEYAGLDPDEYWATPTMVWREQDWKDLHNWIKPNQTVKVPYYIEEDDEWYYRNRKIETVEDVLALCEKYGCSLDIPTPWEGFSFGKLEKCQSVGHIWVKCVCSVCGEKRDHTWGFSRVGHCATCQNLDTKWKSDKRCKSGRRPDGFDEKCEHLCDEMNEQYHRGWHHVGEQYDQVSCVCQCELYSEGNRHKLSEQAVSQVTQWTDSGDGETHLGLARCERSDNTQVKFREMHTTEPDPTRTDAEYEDNIHHRIHTRCTKHSQGCTYTGYISTTHTRDENCWCSMCGHYCHVFTGSKTCGRFTEKTCIYCGKTESGYDFIHDFCPARNYSDDEHTCQCGEEKHEHSYENGKCVGGKDCDEDEDTGCGRWKTKKSWGLCRHKDHDPNKDPEDEHEEAELPFPDNPGGGRKHHCEICGGDYENTILKLLGEWWEVLKQFYRNKGYTVNSPKDLPDCTFRTSVLRTGISGKEYFTYYKSQYRHTYGFCYDQCDSAIEQELEFTGIWQDTLGSFFLFSIEYPCGLRTANECTGGFIYTTTTNVLYDTIQFSGSVSWDEVSQSAGVKWSK